MIANRYEGLRLGDRVPARVVEPADAKETAAALAAAAQAGERRYSRAPTRPPATTWRC